MVCSSVFVLVLQMNHKAVVPLRMAPHLQFFLSVDIIEILEVDVDILCGSSFSICICC